VVNGPSSDGTAELLSGYPVRVGTCSEAQIGRSRNVGVRMAAGDVFAFLDDDAVPEPDWLEQLAGAYEDPMVAAAGGPVFDVPLGRIEWAICTCTRKGAVNTHSEPPAERYLGRGADPFLYLAGCNMSVRRSALRRAGAFNPELLYGYDDAEVCMRLVDAGARIAWVEAVLVRHDLADQRPEGARGLARHLEVRAGRAGTGGAARVVSRARRAGDRGRCPCRAATAGKGAPQPARARRLQAVRVDGLGIRNVLGGVARPARRSARASPRRRGLLWLARLLRLRAALAVAPSGTADVGARGNQTEEPPVSA
jgi:glycosyltransferase involved in cell wall biosynthesis